jgi:hypothetical protein
LSRSFATKLLRPEKKRGGFFIFIFISHHLFNALALLAYSQEENHTAAIRVHFLACHTRGMFRDRKRQTACLLVAIERVAIYSGNQDESQRTEQTFFHLAFGDRLFSFLLLLPSAFPAVLAPNAFLRNVAE